MPISQNPSLYARKLAQGESRSSRPSIAMNGSPRCGIWKPIRNSRSPELWRPSADTISNLTVEFPRLNHSSDRSFHCDEICATGICQTRPPRRLSGRASISPETLLSSSRGAFWTLRRMFDPPLSAPVLPSLQRSCAFFEGNSTTDGLHHWSKPSAYLIGDINRLDKTRSRRRTSRMNALIRYPLPTQRYGRYLRSPVKRSLAMVLRQQAGPALARMCSGRFRSCPVRSRGWLRRLRGRPCGGLPSLVVPTH